MDADRPTTGHATERSRVVGVCPHCRGSGFVSQREERCCGNYLDSGECCAAIHGTANIIVEFEETECGPCRGTGEIDP